MAGKRVLILGGTAEANELAGRLAEIGDCHPVLSLAGRTRQPRRPDVEFRTGGFGGSDGLATYLRDEAFAALIDATHPFAGQITANAHAAAADTRVPYFRLLRPGWVEAKGDHWIRVADAVSGAEALTALRLPADAIVFLALGHRDLEPFAAMNGLRVLLRGVEPVVPPAGFFACETLIARGPFSETEELDLLSDKSVGCIVARDSGGASGYAKLKAARRLDLPVILIDRPRDTSPGSAVESVEAAIVRLRNKLVDKGRS